METDRPDAQEASSVTVTSISLVIFVLAVVYHLVTKTDTFLTALTSLKDRFISSTASRTTKGTTTGLAGGTRERNRKTPQDHDSEKPGKDSHRRFQKTYRSIRRENDAYFYRLQSLEERKRNWRSYHNIPLNTAQERVAREHHVFIAATLAAFDLAIPAFRSIQDTNTVSRRLEGFAKAADIGGARTYLETLADSTGIDS